MLQMCHAIAADLLRYHAYGRIAVSQCICFVAAFLPHSKHCLLLFRLSGGLLCGVKGMSSLDSDTPTSLSRLVLG